MMRRRGRRVKRMTAGEEQEDEEAEAEEWRRSTPE